MKKIFAIILSLFTIISLCSCTGGVENEDAIKSKLYGTWKCTVASDKNDTVYTCSFSKEDNACTYTTEVNGKLDGNINFSGTFTVDDTTITCTGTNIKDEKNKDDDADEAFMFDYYYHANGNLVLRKDSQGLIFEKVTD